MKATLGATLEATLGATQEATLGATLQEYRKKRGFTQYQLAKRMCEFGYPIKNGAVSTWENGTATPNAHQFLALCQILDITDIYSTFICEQRLIPLRLMSVAAGTGELVDDCDTVATYIETTNGLADYALRLNGDSMYPLYRNHEIVLVQNTQIVRDGDIGIFYVDGFQYCKKIDTVGKRLVSINPLYDSIDISHSDCFRVLGKVVGIFDRDSDSNSDS